MSLRFYHTLQPLQGFGDIFESRYFKPVPRDWYLVLTDVIGSTLAIDGGRYKDVNTAGSLGAMAISNFYGHMNFPFFFGGDGMTSLVPGGDIEAIRSLLCGTCHVVKAAFDLDLRLCIVPVEEVYRQGGTLNLARWVVSNNYHQAIIQGNGLDIAEGLMKAPSSSYLVDIQNTPSLEPNLQGYTCRWKDFPSHKEETIALIVRFCNQDSTYLRAFLAFLDTVLGETKDHHPLSITTTKARFSARNLSQETSVFTKGRRGLGTFFFRQLIRLQIIGTMVAVKLKIPLVYAGRKDLSRVQEDNIASSDYKKYDNSLKMILAVSTKQRVILQEYLERAYREGSIYYGLHKSDRAMLTCLLQAKTGEEVHFVDAADGGYAYAARALKEQMNLAH